MLRTIYVVEICSVPWSVRFDEKKKTVGDRMYFRRVNGRRVNGGKTREDKTLKDFKERRMTEGGGC